MILKGLNTFLRLAHRNPFKFLTYGINNKIRLTNNILFLSSNESEKKDNHDGQKQQQRKQRKGQNDYKRQRDEKRRNRENTNLAQILKQCRIYMNQYEPNIEKISQFAKKIASNYTKSNHSEYIEQKDQIEGFLQTIEKSNIQNLQIGAYCRFMDFIRMCSNLEYVDASLYSRVQDKLFKKFNQYQKHLDSLQVDQIAVLYCKLIPLYHPDSNLVSRTLHDKLADQLDKIKKISLTLSMMFMIIRSMGNKHFLSFPDKKILEIILLAISQKRIDPEMTLKLAIAFKDLQVQVNISNSKIYEISHKIQAKAVKFISKGVSFAQIEPLIWSKPTSNPYFIQIFEIIAQRSLDSLKSEKDTRSLARFRYFVKLVRMIPSSFKFSREQQETVVEICSKLLSQLKKDSDRQKLQLQLLELIRHGFFSENLSILNPFFSSNKTIFVWSFITEYSKKGIPFPLEYLESRIPKDTSKIKIQTSFLRLAFSVSVQAKLQPSSAILQETHSKILQAFKQNQWSKKDLSDMVKIAIVDPQLISSFHQEYQSYYLPSLIPKSQEIKKEKQLRKDQKSDLYKFWQYLLIQNEVAPEIVSQIPEYAITLTAMRQKKIKNQDIAPKLALLQAINYNLSSNKIKLSSSNSSLLIQILIFYSNSLDSQNEYLWELYWNFMNHIIDQYGYFKKTSIPYANYIISKSLHTENPKVRHSIYYKRFLDKLLKSVGLLKSAENYDFFKTTIQREALRNNFLHDMSHSLFELDFFSEKEKAMIKALSGSIDSDFNFNSQNLLIFFKLSKLPEQAASNIEKIIDVIQKSSSEELAGYLIHYCFQYNKIGQTILSKIIEQFTSKIDIAKTDIMALLRNITHLSRSNFKLFEKILLSICQKLLVNPSVVYLADHQEILKILHQHNIVLEAYEQAVWEQVKRNTHRGSIVAAILVELSRESLWPQINSIGIDLARRYRLSNQQDLLRLMIFYEEGIQDFKEKTLQIISNIHKPINNSLFLAYLESRYQILLALTKNNSSFLQRANSVFFKLFELIQERGINLRLDGQHGQNIYLIGNNIILIFVKRLFAHQNKVIRKMVQHLYPKLTIIEANAEGSFQDAAYTLNQLHLCMFSNIKADGEVFDHELVQNLKDQLRAAL